MNGILLVSRRTYSLSKNKEMTVWLERPYMSMQFTVPRDFDERMVNAHLHMKDLYAEFNEFKNFMWDNGARIKKDAIELNNSRIGPTDIAWYIEEMHIAFILCSHRSMQSVVYARTIDDLKSMLLRGEDVK